VVEPARKTLADRYELRGLLAAGGMGQVWRAHDQLLGRPVAVKVLRSEYTGDELFLARFRAEAQHAAALSHPNIAAVYDYGEEAAIDGSGEHLAYLVMELVEGESLSTLLARTGSLTPERTLDLLQQTAAALAAAHEAGVVHRDVKPGNVLVRWDGTVKITDFGIAWSAGSVPLTQTGQVIGTASYLSPEQAAGAHATPASDVYALGMVGYECLAGERAFDGDNSVTIALRHLRDQPAPLPAEVPEGIRTLVEHALVKDPVQRYPDGAAFLAAIDEVLAGRQLPPVRRTDTQSFWLLPDAAALAGAAPATGETPRPPTGVRARAGRALVPLVALLVGAGLAALVLRPETPLAPPPATTAATAPVTAAPEPAEVVLERPDYVGRPAEAVRQQLEAMGLQVQLAAVVTAAAAPDTVVDVAPLSVRLEPGQTVLLSYAVAPRPRSTAPRAPAEVVVQSPEPVPSSEAPAPSTTPPAPSGTATPAPGETTGPEEDPEGAEDDGADAGEDVDVEESDDPGTGTAPPSAPATSPGTATSSSTATRG
jgi:serine/threonine-protein kinase